MANIHWHNGNYSKIFIDIPKMSLKQLFTLRRVYNSNSQRVGYFGVGWGSIIETNLKVLNKKNMVINEYGNGKERTYKPISSKVLVDSANEGQKLYRVKKGYKRTTADGEAFFFNGKGQLTKVVYPDGRQFSITRKDDKITKIDDKSGLRVTFSWNSDGFISQVESTYQKSKRKIVHEYQGDLMIRSKDQNSRRLRYSYNRNKQITKIVYNNAGQITIDYDPKTYKATKVVDIDKSVLEASYKQETGQKETKLTTSLIEKDLKGMITKFDIYSYIDEVDKKGNRYPSYIWHNSDGYITETHYQDLKCKYLPSFKKTDDGKTKVFKYDKNCLLVETKRGDDFEKYKYDKKLGKITQCVSKAGTYSFQYSKTGNLTSGKGPYGSSFQLTYDKFGQIIKAIYKDQKNNSSVLLFKYNSIGKVLTMELSKICKVKIIYDQKGQYKESKVEGYENALPIINYSIKAIKKLAQKSLSAIAL